MAGNIIHAVATTNAIVGGLIVIEAMKLLAGVPEHSKVCPPVYPVTHSKFMQSQSFPSQGSDSLHDWWKTANLTTMI